MSRYSSAAPDKSGLGFFQFVYAVYQVADAYSKSESAKKRMQWAESRAQYDAGKESVKIWNAEREQERALSTAKTITAQVDAHNKQVEAEETLKALENAISQRELIEKVLIGSGILGIVGLVFLAKRKK